MSFLRSKKSHWSLELSSLKHEASIFLLRPCTYRTTVKGLCLLLQKNIILGGSFSYSHPKVGELIIWLCCIFQMGGSTTRLPLPNLAGKSFFDFFPSDLGLAMCFWNSCKPRVLSTHTLDFCWHSWCFSFHLWTFGLDPQQSPKKNLKQKNWYWDENLWQWQTMKKTKYPCVMGILGEKKKAL